VINGASINAWDKRDESRTRLGDRSQWEENTAKVGMKGVKERESTEEEGRSIYGAAICLKNG
jgi:hypothetical protein